MTTMNLSPAPIYQFSDSTGVPLVGGKLFCYAAGTTTKQAAFTDSLGATPLPNPIILNSRGEIAPSAVGTSTGLWLDPTLAYKFVLAPATDTDPPTNSIWTLDNVVSPQSAVLSAIQQYEATMGGFPIGGQMAFGGSTAPVGWLFCDGSAVSRTKYASLFAVIGIAYGPGDGATTFNLPDKRGRISLGTDNMGGTTAGNVTQAVTGIDAIVVGSHGGDQHAQKDNLTTDSNINVTITDPGHIHTLLQNYNITSGTTQNGPLATTGAPASPQTASMHTAYTGIKIQATSTVTVASGLIGTAQNMPPVEVDNWIIFTGVAA